MGRHGSHDGGPGDDRNWPSGHPQRPQPPRPWQEPSQPQQPWPEQEWPQPPRQEWPQPQQPQRERPRQEWDREQWRGQWGAYEPPPTWPAGHPPPAHPPPAFAPPPPRRRRRFGLVAVLTCLSVLGLALASVVIVRPGPVDGWLAGAEPSPAASEQAAPPPSPVLAAAAGNVPAPTAAGVAAVLDPLVKDPRLGSRVWVSIVDVASGESLYGRGVDTPATPASTAKLVTALTVLAARGPTYRLATRAVAGPGAGQVVLVGGGDPTLAAAGTPAYPGAARLVELAAQVKRALGGTAPNKVIVDSSLFTGPAYGPAWDSDIPGGGYGAPTTALMTDGARVNPKDTKGPAARYQRPDLAAGQAFARSLGLPVSAVTVGKAPEPPANGGPSAGPGATPGATPGAELGRVSSPPLVRLVEVMLAESDNVIAEALARQVALAKGQPASYAGGAAAMKAVLAELGLNAAEGELFDGSGLSRADRLTASLLTDVLSLAARPDRPELHGIFSGLPVAGYSGTLRERFRSPGPTRPGAGVVRAKTGSLSGVNTISGIVTTQQHRLLAFAVLADRTSPGQAGPQDALDRITTALAMCGCR